MGLILRMSKISPSPRLPDPRDGVTESRPGLLRALGFPTVVAIVVGNVIGSGIFAKPGNIAAEAGNFGLVVTAWMAGGVLCLLGALSFAELGVMMPRAGGLYVFLREVYGRLAAFLFGWSDFLFMKPASIGALASIFIGSMARACGWQTRPVGEVLLAGSLIALMAGVNVLGVVWGGRMQSITTLLKATFLAAVTLLPFVLAATGSAQVSFDNLATTVSPRQDSLAGQFAVVLLAVMWAYNGWEDMPRIAEEIRDPQRIMPRALLAGIAILVLLYVGANVAYHLVLSMQEMKDAGDHAAEAMILRLIGPAGERIMSIGIMLSTFGAINSNLLLGPRVSVAMGRDDVFFRILGRVHVNYRTPAVAILVQALMAIALYIASAVLVHSTDMFREKSAFELLTNYVIFSSSIFYALAVLAVVILRRRHPEWERPFRTPFYPWVPLAYVGFYCWFLYQVFSAQPWESATGLELTAAGIPVYYAYRIWARRHPEILHDGQ